MKNWMDAGRSRQLELISHWSNSLNDLEKSIKATSEFVKSSLEDGVLAIRLQFKENLITLLKPDVMPLGIGHLLHAMVGILQINFKFLYQGISVSQLSINFIHNGTTRMIKGNRR